jgi:hypothetical protein
LLRRADGGLWLLNQLKFVIHRCADFHGLFLLHSLYGECATWFESLAVASHPLQPDWFHIRNTSQLLSRPFQF